MAEIIEEVDLGNGTTKRIYDNGRITVVDSEGKFAPGGYLPPEVARTLGGTPGVNRKVQQAEESSEILAELGLSGPSAERLAHIFVSSGAGSVGAARELIRMSAHSGTTLPGLEICPRCGYVEGASLVPGTIDIDKLLMVIDALPGV